MNWGIRGVVLAAGAAALLSTQAVYAAPPRTAVGVDPLVSLSLMAGTASQAAVCAGSTAATAAASAAVQAAPGCVLPVTAAPAPMAPMAEAAAPLPVAPGIGMLPLLLGLGALVALTALLVSGGGNAKGDFTPVSPD